ALGIREVLTGERVECADLDFGVAQAGDARRRRAKLPGVGQRTVAKVDLRHFEVAVSRARQRGQNLGPRRRAAEAGEDGCLRERRGWAERSLERRGTAVELLMVVEPARKLDIRRT